MYKPAGLTSKPHHAHRQFLAVYVDRFACDWHRFSTTDLSEQVFKNVINNS
jgi:hypothetical protein